MTITAQALAPINRRLDRLELEKTTYRKATVRAVHPVTSTYDADVEGIGLVEGFTAPRHFLPQVDDEIRIPLNGSVPGFEPGRIAPGAVGEQELAPYVTENITIAMNAANGKNKFFFSPDAPTSSTPGTKAGDPWMRRDNVTRVITGSWEWDGDSWEPVTFGDQVLASLTVGKLVGGTGAFDLVVGGRIANAMTGQRTELNPLGLQGFNPAGTLTVNIDGVNNLLTGEVRTGQSTVRHVRVGGAGNESAIRLMVPGGPTSYLRSYADSPNGEGLQLGMPVTAGGGPTWNSIFLTQQEWASYRTLKHDFLYQDRWAVFQTGDRGFSEAKLRLFSGPDSFQIRAGITPADVSRAFLYDYLNGHIRVNYLNNSYVGIQSNFFSDESAVVTFANGTDGLGGLIRTVSNTSGVWFELRNIFNTGFLGVRAGAFEINSDARGKTDIVDLDIPDPLAQVASIRPREFRRINGGSIPVRDANGVLVAEIEEPGPVEQGVVAQESPEFIVSGSEDTELSISTMRLMLLMVAAIQQLDERTRSTT